MNRAPPGHAPLSLKTAGSSSILLQTGTSISPVPGRFPACHEGFDSGPAGKVEGIFPAAKPGSALFQGGDKRGPSRITVAPSTQRAAPSQSLARGRVRSTRPSQSSEATM
ncbi:hypothetical protein D9M71_737340 [compost metagenome]